MEELDLQEGLEQQDWPDPQDELVPLDLLVHKEFQAALEALVSQEDKEEQEALEQLEDQVQQV